MFKWLKDALFLTKRERVGLFSVSIIVFLLVVFNLLFPRFWNKDAELSQEDWDSFNQWVAESKSLQSDDQSLENSTPKPSTVLFSFSPDTISINGLLKLGLSRFAAQNFINYRKSGGSFSSPKDVEKIYGIDSVLFQKLKPLIEIRENAPIAQTNQPLKKENKKKHKPKKEIIKSIIYFGEPLHYKQLVQFGFSSFVASNLVKYQKSGGQILNKSDLLAIYGVDSTFVNNNTKWFRYYKPEKLNLLVELNSADTTALKALPGIGSYYAKMIVKYRSMLGGFYNVEQLNEVYGLEDFDIRKIEPYLKIDSTNISQMRIEEGNFKVLLKHPYFDFYHVKEIYNQKEKQGQLTKQQLLENPMLDPKIAPKLVPYLMLDK